MHLYILARGVKRFMERWREDMEAHHLPTDVPGRAIQLTMRPVQLYEIMCPEAQLPKVLELLEIRDTGKYGKKLNTALKWLRKLMGLDEVLLPVVDDKDKKVYSHSRMHVGVHVLGTKKDEYKITKNEVL